jgi:hypothetical protein
MIFFLQIYKMDVDDGEISPAQELANKLNDLKFVPFEKLALMLGVVMHAKQPLTRIPPHPSSQYPLR